MTAAIEAPSLAWIALGGNLGDACQSVQQAIAALESLPQTRLEAASSLYRTAPVDATGPDFINAVARLRTTLSPLALLHAVQGLEQQAGRERSYRNAPRTLDLDVLLYSGVSQQTAELELPHPRMTQRAFVLVPLAEIDPELVPATLLQAVADQAIERLV
ncbi:MULTISPECIES: 2-amino-4-hydroxy-6-hydroxymethyldihydropteridine diphosphokinase [Brachymonas]|uniref:2-amino-4-hydroxy-6- hydroxymethyldihydropteridine diphosphokinase n=1 Tax=Brachymonas TaxID=28219 RepID=UPI0016925621|nr:2-amino-4-hydroxy-6-hydroxymethyldihydropteridine diphosphokinase [Brachymonas sp. J145]MEE1654112.1 2-amino-4-hydroxy-6-hydroxymethyldihydropteridine diphosphokinase [Brachymonas sp. J145]NLX16686.1 2-amino-4-hydroxy-6-hydroxymethyldihydropteridine diphosphokinase [Ramlibacter sp.]